MARPTLRVLVPEDTRALMDFCARHRARSMFLASNASQAPLGTQGTRLAGTYVGAFEGGQMIAAAAHFEMGNLITSAGEQALPLARLALAHSRRPLAGLVGADPECTELAAAVLPGGVTPSMNASEHLFELDLARLAAQTDSEGPTPRVRARALGPDDLDTVCAWSSDYDQESLGIPRERAEAPEARARRRAHFEQQLHRDSGQLVRTWVLEVDGRLAAMTGFNAVVLAGAHRGAVQVGGVWTPPSMRNRGYARRVVRGHLMHAHTHGAAHAVLFTEANNAPAQAVYRRLGFQRVGDWRIILLDPAVTPRV